VTAYKFRDPEGHPLEFLAYPAGTVPAHWADRANRARGPCLGIDHSAISVADTERSVAFYGGLGLKRIASSLNQGIEQEKLDGIRSPTVEVTAMAPAAQTTPAQSTPHVELLCYRGRFPRSQSPAQPNDVASTRLVFDVGNPLECAPSTAPRDPLPSYSATSQPGSVCMLRDPDGHLISLEIPQGEICRHMR
jgi:catechol 2,3-dioxygenase-like lactoylglutathione lyase family enzyme